jgi:putative ABC transport system permease protein
MGLGLAVGEECPGAEYVTRFSDGSAVFTYKDKVFSENFKYADKDFFKMFSFPLLKGNADKIFLDKLEIVLTPALVEKYFGDEDPIGQSITLNFGESRSEFTVTGVIEAPPGNSSLDFKALIPQQNRSSYDRQTKNWGSTNTPTFVQLRSDADTALFHANLDAIRDKYFGPVEHRWADDANEPIPAGVRLLNFVFTPLSDIHLKTNVAWHKVSDRNYSYILGGIALLILLIASINYISLALTTSATRRTEVGIRKVVGAVRKQLFYQFGFESILLALISMIIGFASVILFLPAFNDFTDKTIALKQVNWGLFLLVGLALTLTVGFLAGSYPSLFLARFKPAAVLKGKFTTKLQAGFTRPLVVLQFGMSAFLIVSSVVMYRQMTFIATKDLGYTQNAVLSVPSHAGWNNEAERMFITFKTELEQIPGVEAVTGTSQPFTEGYNRYGYKIDGVNHSAYVYAVEPTFAETLGMKFTSGRNFDPAIQTDSNAVVVNEALVRDMKWTDLDDAWLNWRQDSTSRGYKVIGVLKDFNFLSLESPIEPMLLTLDRHEGGHISASYIRLSNNDMPGTIEKIESTWRRLFPDRPFEYSFLDDAIAGQYKSYQRRMNIMAAATGFAILISCLGLFGLAGVNAVNRTKEIGIRKVMGADVRSIFILLNRQYIWLSLIAFALAIPFSWYVMNKWLAGFQFRITMGWELFAVSVVAGLMVALITVSYHAVRVSMVNPAETLKYE